MSVSRTRHGSWARIVAFAGILTALALVPLVPSRVLVPFATEDVVALADDEALIAAFDDAVFAHGLIRLPLRWVDSVKVAVTGAEVPETEMRALEVLDAFARLSGLSIERVDAEDPLLQLHVQFLDTPAYDAAIEAGVDRWRRIVIQVACFADVQPAPPKPVTVTIPTDFIDPRFEARCLWHEIMHAWGFPTHIPQVRSVLNTLRPGPTVNDIVLIRALYDARIRPGMPKYEVLQFRLPEILADLRSKLDSLQRSGTADPIDALAQR